MKMKVIMKRRSHRKAQTDLNVGTYTNMLNIKKCLGKMMLICIKQPLNNI